MQGLPQIGDILDHDYELLGMLGKGGFGAVYLARQLNMDREVALKVLVASGPKYEEMVKRFRREVMAIRNLSHPNTIRIYDYRDDTGLLYYTMEALRGQTLKDLIQNEGPISPRRVKHLMRQVLKSLSEAHSQGIVHRDLKPANIMLVDMHGETDFVKVLDFGIAKMMAEPGDEEDGEQLTSAGILVGTLRYMAPEQITGQGIGPHSDLYALGLITVEMLSGESIFAGSGQWELLQQQISPEPVQLHEQLLATPLGGLLRRVLEKNPIHRYAGADEMLAALDAISDADLPDEPIFAPDNAGGFVATRTVVTPQPVAPEAPAPQYGPVSLDTFGQSDDKTEIRPTFSPEQFGMNRLSAPAGATIAPGTLNVNDNRRADATGEFEAASGGARKGVLVAIVAVVALVAAAAVYKFVLEPQTADDAAELASAVEAPVAPAAVPAAGDTEVARDEVARDEPADRELAAGEAAEAPLAADGEEAGAPTWVRLQTGFVAATVYEGDDMIGRTPMRYAVREALELRLEAPGYESMSVRLDADSPEVIELEMVKVDRSVAAADDAQEAAPAGSRETTRASGGAAATSSSTRTSSGTASSGTASSGTASSGSGATARPASTKSGGATSAPSTETAGTKKTAAPSDWVDIAPAKSASTKTAPAAAAPKTSSKTSSKTSKTSAGGDWVDIAPKKAAPKANAAESEPKKPEVPLF